MTIKGFVHKILVPLVWVLMGILLGIFLESPIYDYIFGKEVDSVKLYFSAEAKWGKFFDQQMAYNKDEFMILRELEANIKTTSIYDSILNNFFYPKSLEFYIFEENRESSLIWYYTKDKPLLRRCNILGTQIEEAILQCNFFYSFNIDEYQTGWLYSNTIPLKRTGDFNKKMLMLELTMPKNVSIVKSVMLIGDQEVNIPIVESYDEPGLRKWMDNFLGDWVWITFTPLTIQNLNFSSRHEDKTK
jgi:hypothetical protein